jgi:hypothetical protein
MGFCLVPKLFTQFILHHSLVSKVMQMLQLVMMHVRDSCHAMSSDIISQSQLAIRAVMGMVGVANGVVSVIRFKHLMKSTLYRTHYNSRRHQPTLKDDANVSVGKESCYGKWGATCEGFGSGITASIGDSSCRQEKGDGHMTCSKWKGECRESHIINEICTRLIQHV